MGKGIFKKLFAVTLSWALSVHPLAYAAPQNGTIISGNISISNSGNTTTIRQNSQKGIIDWQSFNIGTNEHTQFNQPNTSSITLNRVTGGNTSHILGSLNANGHVWIVNPQGIVFGAGSRVDVGGLLATTNDITNQNFISNNFIFTKNAQPGFISNQGLITIKDAGYAALVSPIVHNSGIIQAKLGKIALSGGEAFTFDMYGDDLIKFAVGSDNPLYVENSGILKADGGHVLLTTQDVKNMLGSVIHTSGLIEGTSLQNKNGKISIIGGENSDIYVSGIVNASGVKTDETGGSIDILGDEININNSYIDASGDVGGGNIRIGGDYQGQGETKTATNLWVTPKVKISANAITNGNGGRIINWANNNTYFYGNVEAKGGYLAGNGGFAEISGKKYLDYKGSADLTANNGLLGSLLLDPQNITIFSFTPTDVNGLSMWVDASDASTLNLSGSNVTQWNDKSGLNNHLTTPGNDPDLVTAGLNGLDVIDFSNPAGEYFAGNVSQLNNSAGGYTTVMMLMKAVGVNGKMPIGFTTYDIYTTGGRFGYNTGAGNSYGMNSALVENTWSNLTFEFYNGDTSNNAIYHNGVNQTLTGRTGVKNVTDAFKMGGWNNSTGYRYNGQMAEVFMFNEQLNANDRQSLEQYQNVKWGQGLATPFSDYSVLTETFLEAQLATANVVIQADDNITMNSLDDGVLNMAQTTGSLSFIADADSNGVGDFTMDIADTIRTAGGDLSIQAEGMTIGTLESGNGDIDLDANASVSFADLNAGTGNVTVEIDKNNNTINNLTAGAITANTITLTGGTDANDTASLNGTINAGAGGLSLVNFSNTNLGANITTTAGEVAINSTTNVTANSQITTNNANITLTGAVNGANDLTLNAGTGTVDLQSDVGDTTPLNSLNITGSTISAEAVTTSGSQNYTGNTTLNGDITTSGGDVVFDDLATISANRAVVTNDGKISFVGGVDGSFDLNLTTGNGDITFGANSGETNRLNNVTIASAKNVTNNAILKANGFVQTAGTGTTNLGTSGGLDITGNVDINTASIQGNIVTAQDVTYKATGDTSGDITVASLTLESGSAELTGSIAENVGKLGAKAIDLTKTIDATGPFTFNDITFPVIESSKAVETAITVISSLSSGDLGGGSSGSAGGGRSSSFTFTGGNNLKLSRKGHSASTPGDLASALQSKKSMAVGDPFDIDFRLITAEEGSESRYRGSSYLFEDFWIYLESKTN